MRRINRSSGLRVSSSKFQVPSSKLKSRGGAGAADFNLKPETRNSEPTSPWRVGQNVLHPKFGAGVIVGAEGRGADARVQVNFNRNGLKWLALEYAKLSAA